MSGFLDYVESLQTPPRTANPLLLAEEKTLNADGKHKKIVLNAKVFFAAHKHRMNSENQDGYTGGSYPWLADTITQVVTNLRRHNLEPIVVALNIENHRFVSDDLSEFTPFIEKVRDLDQECPYTLQFTLRHLVVASVLLKLNVETMVADTGAGQTMAEIANELGCPALAMYYRALLYPIHAGVMFIGGQDYWKYRSRLYSGKDILVREWNYKELVETHDGITTDHYAMMAATDELDRTVNRPPEFYERLVESVKEASTTDEEMIDKLVQLSGSPLPYENARLKFVNSWKKYGRVAKIDPDSETLITYLRSKEFRHDTRNRQQLPPIFQERMRRNLFPLSFWSMLVTRKAHLHIGEENLDMQSAKMCSRRIRQFSYALLLNFDGPPSGEEYFHIDGDYVAFPARTEGLTSVSLEDIPDLSVDERRTILLEALDVDTIDTDDLTSETSLLTAAIHYWVKHCQPGAEYQEAMRIDTISDQFDRRDFHTLEGFITPTGDYSSRELREILHPIAQFSSILQDAIELSSLLLDPCGEVQIQAVFDVPYLLHTVLESKSENESKNENEASSD